MSDEIATIRASQRARRNAALGILGTALTAAVSLIVQLVQIERADAEKAHLAMNTADVREELAAIRRDINALLELRRDFGQLTERVTRAETKLDERTRPGSR